MNTAIFKKGMALLATVFPEKDIASDISWRCLCDLTDEQFIKAIKVILQTEKQINKATNIIALIRDKALTKDYLLAGEAWSEVLTQVRRVGSYGYPKFSDKLIDKAIDALGWRNICLSTNLMAERAHFLKIYDTYVNRDTRESLENIGNIGLEVKKMIGQIAKDRSIS